MEEEKEEEEEEETRLEYQKPSSYFVRLDVYQSLSHLVSLDEWWKVKKIYIYIEKGNIHWASQIESCWDEKYEYI